MAKVRGIVMEWSEGTALLLTPDGDLVPVPVPDRAASAPGAEIEVDLPVAGATTRSFRWQQALRWAAAAAALAMALGGALRWGGTPAATAAFVVAVDINPGCNLEVDARGTVVGAQPTNADGARVLENQGLDGQSIEGALETLVHRASELGYLSGGDGPVIMISVVSVSAKAMPVSELARRVDRRVRELLPEAEIRLREAPRTELDAARASGISLNASWVLSASQQHGLEITAGELAEEGIKAALAEQGMTAVDLLPDEPPGGLAPVAADDRAEGSDSGTPAAAGDPTGNTRAAAPDVPGSSESETPSGDSGTGDDGETGGSGISDDAGESSESSDPNDGEDSGSGDPGGADDGDGEDADDSGDGEDSGSGDPGGADDGDGEDADDSGDGEDSGSGDPGDADDGDSEDADDSGEGEDSGSGDPGGADDGDSEDADDSGEGEDSGSGDPGGADDGDGEDADDPNDGEDSGSGDSGGADDGDGGSDSGGDQDNNGAEGSDNES